MNRDTIRQKLQSDQRWLERAIVALNEGKKWADPDQNERGSYLANWIIKGNHFSGKFIEEARALSLQYVDELLDIALATTRQRIVDLKAEKERTIAEFDARIATEEKTIAQISEALSTLDFTPPPLPVLLPVAPPPFPAKPHGRQQPFKGGGPQSIQREMTAGDRLMPDGSGRTVSQACFEDGIY